MGTVLPSKEPAIELSRCSTRNIPTFQNGNVVSSAFCPLHIYMIMTEGDYATHLAE